MALRHVYRKSLTAFAATLLIGALPAVASAECPELPTTLQFASYGDSAEYVAVPGGTFEEAIAPGWSLSNSGVSTDAEGPRGNSGSLVIQPGGVAVSPPFCVSSAYPTFRFFARQISGSGTLSVRLRRTNGHGFFIPSEISAGSLQGGTSWALSPSLDLAKKLTLFGDSTATIELVFESSRSLFSRGATWAIDDVYVDPYRR